MHTLEKLWMDSHVALAHDGRVTVTGNRHDPGTVIAVLWEVSESLPFTKLDDPDLNDLEFYLRAEGREEEIEYLTEI